MSGRRTRQREAVRQALSVCQDFVSAQVLHARVAAAGSPVGLSTVYRTLRELETAGRVDVVRDDAGERLYRERPVDGHRHYLICRSCSRSQPVDSEVVEEWAGRIGTDTGFVAVEHTLELTGICTGCQPHRDEGELTPCHWDPARSRARSCVR
ncbi:transcriptional repressor [Streptomyces sp. MspMP-M5]|uniref:Fur family transcriptional regulator n=1 Tax=unclassified Streptomyces TaxID=2593676 RepID=UPI00037953D7|nr:transcriptional repressor [Streptomyces sp. MspMP-M5]MYT30400.1 transcriptional repressor [Streptomyces sp. SID8354]